MLYAVLIMYSFLRFWLPTILF